MAFDAEVAFQKFQLKFAWSASARQEFYQLLADFVQDGVPVNDALTDINARWFKTKNAKALITSDLLSALRGSRGQAQRLGESLRNWVPSMESMAVDAGEQSGDIVQGLRMAAKLTGVKAKVMKTIKGEMIQPAILILMFCGVLLGINSQVLPILDEVLDRSLWPALPALLGKMGDNVYNIVGGFIGFIISVAVIYSWTVDRWTGTVRDKFDRYIFPWSMNRQISGSIILAIFSAMMNARIPLSETLAKMSATATPWENVNFSEMKDRMRRGLTDGEVMSIDLFDEPVQWKLGVYGKLSAFSQALIGLSDRQIEATIARISGTMKIIAALCMVSVAGMVVMVYFSFMQITQAAKSAAQMGM